MEGNHLILVDIVNITVPKVDTVETAKLIWVDTIVPVAKKVKLSLTYLEIKKILYSFKSRTYINFLINKWTLVMLIVSAKLAAHPMEENQLILLDTANITVPEMDTVVTEKLIWLDTTVPLAKKVRRSKETPKPAKVMT